MFCFHDVATASSLLTRPVLSKKLKVEIGGISNPKSCTSILPSSSMKCFPKSISLPSVVTKATAASPSKTSVDAAVAAVSSELDGQRMALKASLCRKDVFTS